MTGLRASCTKVEMTVLVTVASKHGATLEMAEAIARVLDEHGVSADLVDIDEVSRFV
jgi:menaquinone-dependent protoporphyrinogen IX oxidase